MGVTGEHEVIVKRVLHVERGVRIAREQKNGFVRRQAGREPEILAPLPEVRGAGDDHWFAADLRFVGTVLNDDRARVLKHGKKGRR